MLFPYFLDSNVSVIMHGGAVVGIRDMKKHHCSKLFRCKLKLNLQGYLREAGTLLDISCIYENKKLNDFITSLFLEMAKFYLQKSL